MPGELIETGDAYVLKVRPDLPRTSLGLPTKNAAQGQEVDWGYDAKASKAFPREIRFQKAKWSREEVLDSDPARGECDICNLGVEVKPQANGSGKGGGKAWPWVLGLGAAAGLITIIVVASSGKKEAS